MENKIEEVIEEDQFRFLKGKDIIDAIGLMRIISERVLDVKEEMCLWFIGFQKLIVPNCWKCSEILELLERTAQPTHGTKSKTAPQSSSVEESDGDAAGHPYYLTYMENI